MRFSRILDKRFQQGVVVADRGSDSGKDNLTEAIANLFPIVI